MSPEGLLLAIDTATSVAVVAIGDGAGRLLAEERWSPGFRHGEELLIRVDSILAAAAPRGPSDDGSASGPVASAAGSASATGPVAPVAGSRAGRASFDAIAAIIVGLGPGAFTGLRVGLATAKGLALALGRPIVGVPTALALLEAAREPADALPDGAAEGRHGPTSRRPAGLLLPAGPSDRVLVRTVDEAGSGTVVTAVRLGPDDVPGLPLAAIVGVDLDGRADPDALARGRRAQALLAVALLRLGAERLATHGPDDLAAIVPEYVTLPRGVEHETGRVVVASS